MDKNNLTFFIGGRDLEMVRSVYILESKDKTYINQQLNNDNAKINADIHCKLVNHVF